MTRNKIWYHNGLVDWFVKILWKKIVRNLKYVLQNSVQSYPSLCPQFGRYRSTYKFINIVQMQIMLAITRAM
jgi:hypothetical protein